MKKLTGLTLVCVLLTLVLSGCSSVTTTRDDSGENTNFNPEATVSYAIIDVAVPTRAPETTQPVVQDIPLEQTSAPTATPEPVYTPEPALTPEPTSSIDLSSYTFDMVRDESFGFTFAYPVQWENVPGKSTICFREEVEEGDFPARVAVTRKALAHTPNSEKVLAQFQSYVQVIYEQYDSATFELGELNSNAKFMGQSAHEITYLAYSGDVEVKGYAICCNVGRSVYVFHFCASYDDYAALESIMTRMRDSVAVIE